MTLAQLNEPEPSTAVFRVRLGLTALDLAGHRPTEVLAQLRRAIIAVARSDSYAARDALKNQVLREHLTTEHKHDLTAALDASGLGRQALTESQTDELFATVQRAERYLRTLLDRR